jgi:hypothetical protein
MILLIKIKICENGKFVVLLKIIKTFLQLSSQPSLIKASRALTYCINKNKTS